MTKSGIALRRTLRAGVFLAAISAAVGATPRKPDVVFVLLDDLRWDEPSYIIPAGT